MGVSGQDVFTHMIPLDWRPLFFFLCIYCYSPWCFANFTARLRLTMSKGHLDPWNFGVLFGLRSFAVLGRNDAATAGTSSAWDPGLDSDAPGLWLALEHPRSRCHVDQQQPQTEEFADHNLWRKVTCSLRMSEKAVGRSCFSASLGIFEDGKQSQLRRSFGEYLQLARGRPFGQVLHYNSCWADACIYMYLLSFNLLPLYYTCIYIYISKYIYTYSIYIQHIVEF